MHIQVTIQCYLPQLAHLSLKPQHFGLQPHILLVHPLVGACINRHLLFIWSSYNFSFSWLPSSAGFAALFWWKDLSTKLGRLGLWTLYLWWVAYPLWELLVLVLLTVFRILLSIPSILSIDTYINNHHNPSKNSFFLSWSGIIVFDPGFQLAGQTTPFLSAYWNASIVLRVSSTFLPTAASWIVIERITPFPSMMNNPLKEAPWSSSAGSRTKTPYFFEICLLISERRGIFKPSTPPSFLGVLSQARWENWESVEIAITYALISR